MISSVHSNFMKLIKYPSQLQSMARRLSKCEIELDIISKLVSNPDYNFDAIHTEYQTELICKIYDLVRNKDSIVL